MAGAAPARPRPPSVLYVASSAELYGSDLALLRTVRAHLEGGGSAAVALPADGPLAALLRAAGAGVGIAPIGVLRRRLMRPAGVLRLGADLAGSVRPLVALGRAVSADLVHSNSSAVVSGAVVARILRRPHVVSVREDLGGRGGAVPALLSRLGADRAVAVSETVRRTLLARRPGLEPRLRVVVDGVDTERFTALPDRAAARAALGLDPAGPVVGMLARIKDWKGQTVLVEALAHMGEVGARTQLLLAGDVYPGDEDHLARVRAAILRSGVGERVHLVGFVADPAPVLAAADVLAAPSTIPEPYGLAVVDALCAGVPVVASAAGGHLQTVRDGIDGLLVPAADPVALGRALTELLGDADRLRRMGEAARAGRHRFDAAAGHARLAAVYAELVPPR